MMALGDALAVALLEARGFTAADFRTFHPGGALGAALASVADVMHAGDAVPLASQDAPMSDVLIEMTAKSFGCVGLLDDTGRLAGIITDGDLRRHMGNDLVDRPAHEVMTRNPKTGRSEALAADALREMTAGSLKITQLFIVDDAHKPVGILHLPRSPACRAELSVKARPNGVAEQFPHSYSRTLGCSAADCSRVFAMDTARAGRAGDVMQTPLVHEVRQRLVPHVIALAGFSLVSNLLLLVAPLYMLQVL